MDPFASQAVSEVSLPFKEPHKWLPGKKTRLLQNQTTRPPTNESPVSGFLVMSTTRGPDSREVSSCRREKGK